MQRLDIRNTHELVLEAWEYGTVEGGGRCHVLGHPDGYALLTLDDLCALRFLQSLKNGFPDISGEDPPYPLVASFLPDGISYYNGDRADVFICKEPVTALAAPERRAVMQSARAVFASVALPPDADETESLVMKFRDELRQRGPDWAPDSKPIVRLMRGVRHALHWWQDNQEHAPRESFVFGTALTNCAWTTPRGAVLLPHIFCKD